MERGGRLTIGETLADKENETLSAERRLYIALLYTTLLGHLDEQERVNITGKKILEIIERAKKTPAPYFWIELHIEEFPIDQWQAIQNEASLLRRDRLIRKGVERVPFVQDIKEVTEELMQECSQLNKNAKRHCSFLVKRVFPEDSE